MSLSRDVTQAASGSRGVVLLLSANPMHDTGGGQRSAQLALEFLAREWAVVFVSHGEVTETFDLGLRYVHPRLVSTDLTTFVREFRRSDLRGVVEGAAPLILTQVPVAEWLPVVRALRRAGSVAVYDCIDLWDSELGYGWYRRSTEQRIARSADLVLTTAPVLARRLAPRVKAPVRPLPNAFNARVFHPEATGPRPVDLPTTGPLALYVGALWGRWMDWTLVARMAAALADVSFVFVGDHRGEGGRLPANCHFVGLKAQTDLPPYLSHADVGILPWTSDDVTHATSPLKVYEYLAMGLPVVAPDIEPLRGLPGTTLVEGRDTFIQAVAEVVRTGVGGEARDAMTSFASRNSWTRRVDELLGWVADARLTANHGGRGRANSSDGGAMKVIEVSGASGLKRFVNAPWEILDIHAFPQAVPSLRMSVATTLNPKKNPFWENAERALFLAEEDGHVVGRVAAIHNGWARDAGLPAGFMGFFESQDRQEVAGALLDAAEAWLRARGHTMVRGPLNPSTNYEGGVLISGFEHTQTFLTPWNPPYYPALLEGAGYGKGADLLGWYVDLESALQAPASRVARLAETARKKLDVTVGPIDFGAYDATMSRWWEIYQECWRDQWGFVPLTLKEWLFIAHEMKPLLVPEGTLAVRIGAETVGFILILPDYNRAMQADRSGRLLPLNWLRLLRARKRTPWSRIMLAGILPQYRRSALLPLMLNEAASKVRAFGVKHMEASWILEDNDALNGVFKGADAEAYRVWRVYEKEL